MANKIRGDDIRGCIQCFKACCIPCGIGSRKMAVRGGVCINNCRKHGCCGLGACCAGSAKVCTFLAGSIKGLLVLGLIVVAAFVVFVHWDSIVDGFGTIRNGTEEYYGKVAEDPSVVQVWNKTEQYYGAARDKLTEIGNSPEVQRVGNKTVELYGAAKDQIVDTFNTIHQSDTVQSAINGTVGFWNSLKEKLFG